MKLARNTIRRILIMMVLVSFAQFSLISDIGHASIVDSKMISSRISGSGTRGIDEKKIRRMLENKILNKRLETYGLSDEQIYSKIESMSDEQVHQLASLSDRIPAGGDAGVAALIVLVTIAVAIIVVLLLIVLTRKE
jgi:hypothetical protein